MATINISQLFKKAFTIAPRYLVPMRGGMDLVQSPNYSGIDIWEEEDFVDISPLGTPILEAIVLQGGSYNTFEIRNGVPVQKMVKYQGYQFPLSPMIDVSQDKIIVVTNITGSNGGVLEYIYKDNYQITIRGLLVGEGNSYPHDQRKELDNVFKVDSTYGVVSQILNDQGILAIALKHLDFSDVEGYNNVCAFTINAISDKDVLLEVKEKGKLWAGQ